MLIISDVKDYILILYVSQYFYTKCYRLNILISAI